MASLFSYSFAVACVVNCVNFVQLNSEKKLESDQM